MLFLDTLNRENKRNINIGTARYANVTHSYICGYIGEIPKPPDKFKFIEVT
jgi:hypothetical protein